MRVRTTVFGGLIFASLLIAMAAVGENVPAVTSPEQTNTAVAADPLLQLLVNKGVLNAEEAKSLVGTPTQQRA